MAETMEQYMSKTRTDYGSGVARPKIDNKDQFELKGQFLKELRENTFNGLDNEDANKHIEKVLEIIDLFHVPNITVDQLMLQVFPISLTGAASHWLRNEPTGSIKTWEDLKTKTLDEVSSPLFDSDAGDAAIRNQGASIKTLEIQIGQISKNSKLVYKSRQTMVPFPSCLDNHCCKKEEEGIYGPKFIEAYGASHINHTIPRKEKDPRSFTLLCFINNVCFDNALVDLGDSVSVMLLLTYLNLGLGELAHTRLTIELADRTVKYPKGIAENVLVEIGKFTFPIDFIILNMPEDIKVPLILGRPFLSTAQSKIDV
ncbi:putative ribonuclease H-like domain-containing protein [Tanacetum coccineum]